VDLVWRFINRPLISEPLNWAVIFVVATLWLLAFHTIMKGFTQMQGNAGSFANTAGLVAAPIASNPGAFSVPSGLAAPAYNMVSLSQWGPQGAHYWTDDTEAKYAEDGWMEVAG
jgi:hypothetical protein